jgi:hypothetical protein
MTNDSSALVRVTPAPNSREQNASSVPRSRALQLDGAHRGLHRRRRLPAVPAARPVVIVAPLVADTTEELVDLGLDGDLHHQAHAEPDPRGSRTARDPN